MAALVVGALALGSLIGSALGGNGTNITNSVKSTIENTTDTVVSQLATLNVVTTLQNVNIDIKSSGNVSLNISQTSAGNVMLRSDIVVTILTKAIMSMNQKADLANKSFLGIQLSGVSTDNLVESDVRNVVETKVAQQMNVNDKKLITDLKISVDNSSDSIQDPPDPKYSNKHLIVEPVVPPTAGNVTINITQEASNNITLAATAAIMNELGVKTTVDQSGKIVNSSDPITNFFDGLAKVLGAAGQIWLYIALGVVALILLIAVMKAPPPQQQPMYYPPQQSNGLSRKEMDELRSLISANKQKESKVVF